MQERNARLSPLVLLALPRQRMTILHEIDEKRSLSCALLRRFLKLFPVAEAVDQAAVMGSAGRIGSAVDALACFCKSDVAALRHCLRQLLIKRGHDGLQILAYWWRKT